MLGILISNKVHDSISLNPLLITAKNQLSNSHSLQQMNFARGLENQNCFLYLIEGKAWTILFNISVIRIRYFIR